VNKGLTDLHLKLFQEWKEWHIYQCVYPASLQIVFVNSPGELDAKNNPFVLAHFKIKLR